MTQFAKVKGPIPNEAVNLGGQTIRFSSEAIASVPLELLDYLPPSEYVVLERPQEVENKPKPVVEPTPAPVVEAPPPSVQQEEAPASAPDVKTPKDSTPPEGEKQKRKRGRKPKTSSPKASSAKPPKKGLLGKLKGKRGRKLKK